MIFVALNPLFRIGCETPRPTEGRVRWRYRDGSLSGHGSWIGVEEAERSAAFCNSVLPMISHWVERRK